MSAYYTPKHAFNVCYAFHLMSSLHMYFPICYQKRTHTHTQVRFSMTFNLFFYFFWHFHDGIFTNVSVKGQAYVPFCFSLSRSLHISFITS